LLGEELKLARIEARRRIEEKIPPGYMDANKKGDNAEGDYLIWHETLREANLRRVDVLFVTRDVKKDWWRIEKGHAKGPRWELVAELATNAGTRLFMLRPESLLKHAPDLLAVEVSEDSVQDARRVSRRGFDAWKVRLDQSDLRREAMELAHKLVSLNRTRPSRISDVLTKPVGVLVNIDDKGDATPLLKAIWDVINLSATLSALDESAPEEQDILTSLRRMRVMALNVWLNDQADLYVAESPERRGSFIFAPLPPGVVIVNIHLTAQDEGGIGQYEFTASLSNGETYGVARVVSPTRHEI
jgi:hypothetical protein